MSQPTQIEEVDSGCFSTLFSRLKIRHRRQTLVPEDAVNPTGRTRKSKRETPKPSVAFDAPGSTAVSNEIGNFSQDTAYLELTSHTDLWQEAFKNLDAKEQDILGKGLAQSGGAITLIDTVRARENEFHNESARLKIGENEILWRDCAARVVGWLTSFGNIAITFAPNPASVIWSGLKVLLQAEVDRCEYLVTILKCAETVLPLVRRGAIYEKVYLEDAPEQVPESTRLLKEALCNAYIEVLKLMARVKSDLNKNAGRQFLDAILHPGQDAELVQGLTEAEARIGRDVQACEAEQRKRANKLSGELLRSLETPLRHTQVSLDAVLDTLSKRERSRMLEKFSRVQVGDQHHRRIRMRTEGSGEWLLKHPKFKTWENSNSSSILWLTGQVGAGKTILASSVIDRYWVRDISDSYAAKEGLAYFYYSKNDPGLSDGDPIAQILGSFLRQLATIPGCPGKTFKTLLKLRDDMENKMMTADILNFENALSKLTNLLPRTFIVLDGLDEIERPADADNIIKFLIGLAERSERPIKIFVSSRNELHLRRSLEHINYMSTRINIVDENYPDIKAYIRTRVQEVGRDWPDEVKQKVEAKLCDQAGGMFRWAYLHIEQLATVNSPAEVLTRLDNLPQGLEATYDELYKRNRGHDEICLQRAAKWTIYARRPLNTQELLSAVQLGVNDDRSRLEVDTQLSASLLERICSHLIVKDTKGYWRFSHASVKEYFQEKHQTWILKEARVELAELSLLILIEGFQDGQPPKSKADADSMIKSFKSDGCTSDPVIILRPYVSLFWLNHFEAIQNERVECRSINKLFMRFVVADNDPSCSSLQYQIWGGCMTFKGGNGYHVIGSLWYDVFFSRFRDDILPTDNPAIAVVLFGPRNMEMKWAEECLKQNIAKTNATGLDLLSLAARYGRADLLEKLIELGMDVNKVQRSGTTALIEAVRHRQAASVKLLLQNHADPNVEDLQGIRVLSNAIKLSQGKFEPEIFDLLLEYGAEVDAINSRKFVSGCALEMAAVTDGVGGSTARCSWLLDAGATVNLQTQSSFGSPIVAAALYGAREIVDFLRSHGADVHMRVETGNYGGVLAAAFCGVNPSVMVPYLVEKAKVDPERLISDLSTRKPWMSSYVEERAKAAKYLYSHKYVTIADLHKLVANSSRPVFPGGYLSSLGVD